jgi:hypothetical protein
MVEIRRLRDDVDDRRLASALPVPVSTMGRDPKSTASPASAAADERRQHERLPAERLKGLSLELAPGREVVMQDVSRGGARFQGDSRLLPGLWIALRLVAPEGILTIRSKVVRSRLVRMEKGGMVYEAAVAFAELLPPDTLSAASGKEAESAAGRQTAPADAAAGHSAPAAPPTERDEDSVPLMLLTASVNQPIAELQELLNGNEW